MNPLEKLLATIRSENTTKYLEVITHINDNKLESYKATEYLRGLSLHDVAQLTPYQLILLKSMYFKGGSRIYLYDQRGQTPIYVATANTQSIYIGDTEVNKLPKEDLVYFSDYHKAKWKKANPSSTRGKKGTEFTFKMDMFSLTVFKNNITKKFLRTEVKNLILSVNEAYKASKMGLEQDKIRNKYYYVILNNAEYLTRAAMNAMLNTSLRTSISNTGSETYYNLDADEALAINMYDAKTLMSFTPSSCMDNYSTDTAIVTINNGYESVRENNRVLGAVSALTTIYANTQNEAYLSLAASTAKHLPASVREDALKSTQSIVEMRKIIQGNLCMI